MKLWNKNFTILITGSFISALGSAAAGLGFGILIIIETGSILQLALFTLANIIPRMIANFFVGPFIDRHSRKRTIVTIDFFYALLFGLFAYILFSGFFNIFAFTILAGFVGVIDTIYQTAFMSMFPETVPKGLHSKAFSLASLIWPISAAVMAPITAYLVDNFEYGIAMLMAFNAVTFFVTASMESTIRIKEKLNTEKVDNLQFIHDLKKGLEYYKVEKGILGIALLFASFSFVYAGSDLLRMPYFLNHEILTLTNFSLLISANAIGRIIGGLVHYLFKYPPKHRFLIAVVVYFTVEILAATQLFLPYFIMVTVSFIIGLLASTSFNIRMTAMQTYIPSEMRGRANSAQQLLWNLGAILGTIIIGFTAEYTNINYRIIILSMSVVSITTIFLVPLRMHKEFKKIYNSDH